MNSDLTERGSLNLKKNYVRSSHRYSHWKVSIPSATKRIKVSSVVRFVFDMSWWAMLRFTLESLDPRGQTCWKKSLSCGDVEKSLLILSALTWRRHTDAQCPASSSGASAQFHISLLKSPSLPLCSQWPTTAKHLSTNFP